MLWGRRIAARLHHPENTQQLKQMLIEEWALLPQEMLHQLVLSMRRRYEATIAAESVPEPDEIGNVAKEVINLAKQIKLEMDRDDVQKLLDSHYQELITDVHVEMHEQDIEELQSLDPV
ncbi:hypothetical protein TNCV_4838321 [Trichonephila clavipes]|nr:hypothetical protein TNCV_4838321 [Trichonephila clavipes]